MKTTKPAKLLLCPILMNLFWLGLTILLCDIKYEISDDFVIASIISGGYGAVTSYAPYVNICLNEMLKQLYTFFPSIGWFFVYQVVIVFFSFTALSLILFQKNGLWKGMCLSLLMLIFFADDIYVLPSYTKTAALAVLAGGIFILHTIWDRKKHIGVGCAIGYALLIGGGLLRKESLILCCPFLMIYFLQCHLDALRGKNTINNVDSQCYQTKAYSQHQINLFSLRNFFICLIPLTFVACAVFLDKTMWNSRQDNAHYFRFNNLRSSLIDTASYGYDSIEEAYQNLGLDEVDFRMIQSWAFMDIDIYPAKTIETIAREKELVRDRIVHKSDFILRRIFDRNCLGYWPAIGSLALFVVLCFVHPENMARGSVLLLFSIIFLLYFYWIDRVVFRVEYGVFLGAGLGILRCFQSEEQSKGVNNKSFCTVTTLFLLIHSAIYIPDMNVVHMSDGSYRSYRYDTFNVSSAFKITKYWANTNGRRAYGTLTERIEQDSEHYYLFDFNTTIQHYYYDYKPWISTPVGFYDNFSYFGGITNYYSGNNAMWEKHGIDSVNPCKSLVNDNVFVVDTINHEAKLQYLKKYYYPNARKELVDTIDGLQIWKYYVE